jgi:hypothetical protein
MGWPLPLVIKLAACCFERLRDIADWYLRQFPQPPWP